MKPLMKAWVVILERHLRGKVKQRVLNIISPRANPEFIRRHLRALSSILFLSGDEQCDDAKGGHRFVILEASECDITLDASNFVLRAQRAKILHIEADRDTDCYSLRWQGDPYVPRNGGRRFEPPEMCAPFAKLQIDGLLPISAFPP